MQIFVDTTNDGPITLDVEPMDNIEGVKAKLEDKIEVAPADQCLLFNGVFLEDAQTLDSYGISREGRIYLIELPVLATWSITPDDPALGREVSNSIHSTLEATSYEIIEGALPVGVTLNESSGAISGRFDATGPFDVTVGATTICGVAEVEWSGTVPGTLPATGTDSTLALGALALAATLGLTGAALVAIRRKGLSAG
jgi:LPXTG-motif cell wall-anchored protein